MNLSKTGKAIPVNIYYSGKQLTALEILERISIESRLKTYLKISQLARFKITRTSSLNMAKSLLIKSDSSSSPILNSLLPTPRSTPSLKQTRQNQRHKNFKVQHSPLLDEAKVRLDKVNNFLLNQKIERNQIFNDRRGLWLCGEKQFFDKKLKPNLGNDLHITESSCKTLDRDKDQSTLAPSTQFSWLKHPFSYFIPCSIISMTSSSTDNVLFENANKLMTRVFLKRGILADLTSVHELGYTVDLVIKNHFSQNLNNSNCRVLGALLYVFMKRYIWIEEIVVDEDWRGCGVGKLLIQRAKDIAAARGKTILLYAIDSAVSFYLGLGFQICGNWDTTSKLHNGLYMTF